MYFRIFVLLMIVSAVTAGGSDLALPSQLTGKVSCWPRKSTTYKNALAYVSKNGKFLIGSTILSKNRALTLLYPHFEEYTSETNCNDLKLVAGAPSMDTNGEVCDIATIEPVIEVESDRKKKPNLVLISLEKDIVETEIPVIKLLTQKFRNPEQKIKLAPVTIVGYGPNRAPQVTIVPYIRCSVHGAEETYKPFVEAFGDECLGGFAIYGDKLFGIASLCEYRRYDYHTGYSPRLSIVLINLHLGLDFIKQRILTDSSTTGKLNAVQKLYLKTRMM